MGSTLRLSGMASGMDTDSMIEKLMQVEKQAYYKVERNVTKTEWQIEAYRNVTSKLCDFQNKYLDILGSNNMKSKSALRNFTVNVSDSSGATSNAVSITSTSGANSGSHEVSISQVATKAQKLGERATGVIKGSELTDFALSGKKIELTLDNVKRTIELGDYQDIDEMQQDLQNKINTQFGLGYDGVNGKIICGINGDSLTFCVDNGATSLDIFDDSDALKLKSTSNKINTLSTMENLKNLDIFATPLEFGVAGEGDDEYDQLKFSINGKEFSFDKSATMKEIMDTVNNDTDVNVTLSYNSTSGKFNLSSDNYGASERLDISDVQGNFFTAIGIDTSVVEYGKDTKAIVDGVEISRSAKTFAVDGITYEANAVTEGNLNVKLSVNTDEVYNKIVDFVDSYNTLIKEIDTLLNEEYNKDYQPLTEDERKEMSDDEIEKWEKKAKSGLLKNDSTLNSLLNELRTCFSQPIKGANKTLADIGIKTGTYTNKGKIIIDSDCQAKLKDAIANDLDSVIELFSKTSETYSVASRTYSSAERSTRISEEGLTHRISDILDKYVSSYRDSSGYKGKLLEKAGKVGDTSETTSVLSKKLLQYNVKLGDVQNMLDIKYDRYYAKFSAMEVAIQKANNQANALMSMFGTNTNS